VDVDLTQVQAPTQSLSHWWPVITAVVSLLVSAISGVWAASSAYKTKRLESDAQRTQIESEKRYELEVEKVKGEFERQKDFQQDLIEECKHLRIECQALRDMTMKANQLVLEREFIIRQREDEITQLRLEIEKLRAEVQRLREHVEKLEQAKGE
jgi:predicted RNase H-like nuclease (RuvC/YqgF family)